MKALLGNQLIDVVTAEDLMTALSGLSCETREVIGKELIHAINDTAMEYHKTHDPEVMKTLVDEIASIRTFLNFVTAAQEEFDDLRNPDRAESNSP